MNFDGGWALGQPDLVFVIAEAYTPPVDRRHVSLLPHPDESPGRQVRLGDRHQARRPRRPCITSSPTSTRPAIRRSSTRPIPAPATPLRRPRLHDLEPRRGNARRLGARRAAGRCCRTTWRMSLPAQSRVVLQVHYHPHGIKTVPDQTQIGIYYAKKKPKQLIYILPLINQNFTIPPQRSRTTRCTASATRVGWPAHLWLIAPHMHLLGRKMNVTATLPGGEQKCLINIDDWDFNWQGQYRFSEPIADSRTARSCRSRRSTTIRKTTSATRTTRRKPVSWGEQTTDEMCIAFLGVTLDGITLGPGAACSGSYRPADTRNLAIPGRTLLHPHAIVRSRERAALRSRRAEEPSARLHRGVPHRAGRPRARRLRAQHARPGSPSG